MTDEQAAADCKQAENHLRELFRKGLAAGIPADQLAARANFSVEGLHAFVEHQGEECL